VQKLLLALHTCSHHLANVTRAISMHCASGQYALAEFGTRQPFAGLPPTADISSARTPRQRDEENQRPSNDDNPFAGCLSTYGRGSATAVTSAGGWTWTAPVGTFSDSDFSGT
jgi:hypothetical protein